MRVTIIPADGMVGFNGEFRRIPGLAVMYPDMHAIQWGERGESGHVELIGGGNELLIDPAILQPALDAWLALTPLPPTPAELLAEAKRAGTAGINTACAAEITGGFASSALGSVHTYDSDETDQLNLIGAVGMGADLPYKCADVTGTKAFRLHTSTQLRQVLADGAMVKLAALEKASTLKAQIANAQTVDEVVGVVW